MRALLTLAPGPAPTPAPAPRRAALPLPLLGPASVPAGSAPPTDPSALAPALVPDPARTPLPNRFGGLPEPASDACRRRTNWHAPARCTRTGGHAGSSPEDYRHANPIPLPNPPPAATAARTANAQFSAGRTGERIAAAQCLTNRSQRVCDWTGKHRHQACDRRCEGELVANRSRSESRRDPCQQERAGRQHRDHHHRRSQEGPKPLVRPTRAGGRRGLRCRARSLRARRSTPSSGARDPTRPPARPPPARPRPVPAASCSTGGRSLPGS